jgi:hypothetical protein
MMAAKGEGLPINDSQAATGAAAQPNKDWPKRN